MSVVTIVRVPVEPSNASQVFAAHEKDLTELGVIAQKQGALRHRFARGEHELVIVDEWETAQGFEDFLQHQPRIAEMMREGGMSGEPRIEILEVIQAAGDL